MRLTKDSDEGHNQVDEGLNEVDERFNEVDEGLVKTGAKTN